MSERVAISRRPGKTLFSDGSVDDFDEELSEGQAAGGGAGVSVDNQSDPPFTATGIIAPGAVQSGDNADLTGLQTYRLLTPVEVAFDTPNFMNPSDNGFELVELPANVRATVKYFPTSEWVGASAGDEVVVVLALAVNGSGPLIAAYDPYESNNLTSYPTLSAAAVEARLFVGAADGLASEAASSMPRQIVVESPIKVFAFYAPAGSNPTAGAGKFLIELATPAA